MSRRKHRDNGEGVTLNMAAMLDMAFQLLTFFILTFKPSPIEGQVSMRLPPPEAIITKTAAQKVGSDTSRKDMVRGVTTLVISIGANGAGRLEGFQVGEEGVATLPGLHRKLQNVFRDPANPFEQVILQVDENLRYEELMRVVEVCAAQTMPDGTPLTKLSFVELPKQ